MPRTAFAIATFAFLLAGCAGPETGDLQEPQDDAAADEPSDADPSQGDDTLPEAADGTDVGACYDGECEIVATALLDIPVDPKFGVDLLSVTAIENDVVTLQGTGPGALATLNIGMDAYGVLNGIRVEVTAIVDAEAVLSFSVE
ncbi:MAG: hypothetical protein ACRDXX_21925 [Stackebrandtia sp.]